MLQSRWTLPFEIVSSYLHLLLFFESQPFFCMNLVFLYVFLWFRFTYKVVVEIIESSGKTVLECFGDPRRNKKAAAEHAAEGALWYLEHVKAKPEDKAAYHLVKRK